MPDDSSPVLTNC